MIFFNISKLGYIAIISIMNPQTESDYDPLKPLSEQSTPELLNLIPTVKSRAASDHPDCDEDLAAVLCHRSSTGRVNQLSRVSLPQDCIDHSPCPVNGLGDRWVPPLNSSSVSQSQRRVRRKTNASSTIQVNPTPTQFLVHQSKSSSSKRTQAAAVCHEVHAQNLTGQNLKHHNNQAKKKNKKLQGKTVIEVKVPPHYGAHMWTVEQLDYVELVFDGEMKITPHL